MNRVRDWGWQLFVFHAPDYAWRSRWIFNAVSALCGANVYRTHGRKSC
jgi:hypothetical protein